MSSAFTTRRRAEEFDRLVESARRGSPATGPVSADLAGLADFAAALRSVPEVAPRPAFAADLRERLMAAAATDLVADGTPDAVTARLTVRHNPARRRHERRLTAGIATLAIVGASAGTALASQGSLPGETLYPVKRAIENVRSGFTPSESGKGSALLGDADTRLHEVAQLSRDDSEGNVSEITETLDTFAEQAKKASDLLLSNYREHKDAASIEKLHEFTSDSIHQLAVLEPLLPAAAKDALTSAARAVLLIDTAARNLCPSCGGNPITSLPETLLSATSSTLDSLTRPLHPTRPTASTGSGPATGTDTGAGATTPTRSTPDLPKAPTSVGPANVLPTTLPSMPPTVKGTPAGATGGTSTTPTSTPSTLDDVVKGVTGGLGDAVQGVTGGVGDTVQGVTDGLDGAVGGLLGTKTPK